MSTLLHPSFGTLLALDLGQRWIGIAASDRSQKFVRPYITVQVYQLFPELARIIAREKPVAIIVGHPITCSGTKSAQTVATEGQFDALKKQFADQIFILFDERMTSYSAQLKMREAGGKKRGGHSEHAVAAACLLEQYLAQSHQDFNESIDETTNT